MGGLSANLGADCNVILYTGMLAAFDVRFAGAV